MEIQNQTSAVAISSPAANQIEATELGQRYAELLHSIVDIARMAGFEATAFRPGFVSKFPSMAMPAQQALVERLQTYRDISLSAVENKVDLRAGGHPLAWWAIKSFNLRPLSDAFAHLQKDDVIEIYDNDHVQIFRTFNFLKCTSYSLDEVYTNVWWDLYERDESITKASLALATNLVDKKLPFTLPKPLPNHFVNEKFSARRINAEIESRVVSSLVDANGTPSGYIHAFGLVSLKYLS